MAIGRADMMPLLLDAAPSYAPLWAAYRSSELFDQDLVYIHLGQFADHVVDLLAQGRFDGLPSLCTAIETLHLQGDADVQEAATIGLLEAIQNVAGHRNVSTVALEVALGPGSLRWWNSLNEFWDGRIRCVGADIVPDSA